MHNNFILKNHVITDSIFYLQSFAIRGYVLESSGNLSKIPSNPKLAISSLFFSVEKYKISKKLIFHKLKSHVDNI